MKKKLAIALSSVAVLVIGGTAVAVNSMQEPEAPKTRENVVEKVEPVEVAEDAGASTPTETAPVAQTITPQPVQQPQVDQQCLNDKASALAPFQEKLDEYDRLIQTRTENLTIQYNTRYGNSPPNGVTLEQYIEYDLNQTLRPVKKTHQANYDAEAVKYDC